MSQSSEARTGGHKNTDNPNVIQLGFNVSVAGKSASDFEIYVNDKKQACGHFSDANIKEKTSHSDTPQMRNVPSERSLCDKSSSSEEVHVKSSNASAEHEEYNMEKAEDVTIIDEIKNAMGNFEKFSEHVKEIPRLSTKHIYTSTPYPDKANSLSEGNLSLCGKNRSFIAKHDFRDRKYFKRSKPLNSDLFLKPLPAEDYFKKSYVRRLYDMESYHYYTSMDNLPQYYDYGGEYKVRGRTTAKSDNDKSDNMSSASDVASTEVKSKTEATDKQSTSSESAKDIKIYQSGGIIIMQNFNDNTDLIERTDLIKGDKLAENCNKLKETIESTLKSSDESQKLLLNSSPDDIKGHSGKIVQFDLPCENMRLKSSNSPLEAGKNEYFNSKHEFSKIKEGALFTPQNQDFTSLSTQENDSTTSNLLGMSPTSSTSGKKLEWDSGADVGYLNRDLAKENMSTIERIILKGLSDDGLSKKQSDYQSYQRTETEPSLYQTKCVLERIPSKLQIGRMPGKNSLSSKNSGSDQSSLANRASKSLTSNQSDEHSGSLKREMDEGNNPAEKHQSTQNNKIVRTKHHNTGSKSSRSNKKGKTKSNKSSEKALRPKEKANEEKCVQTGHLDEQKMNTTVSNKSTYVNTLFTDVCFELPLLDISRSDDSGRSESSEKCKAYPGLSPRVKKLKKKKSSQGINLTARLKDKIDNIIEMARYSSRIEKAKALSEDESLKAVDIDQSDNKEMKLLESSLGNSKDKARSRPISASSSSARTVMPNVDATNVSKALDHVKNFSDQIIQTSELMCESKGIQAFQSVASSQVGEGEDVPVTKDFDDDKECERTCSKSIQAPGINSSLPKYLAHPKETFKQLNTKSTQFFGGPITSLPNFHSKEPAVEKVKILKNKTNSDAQNNRIKHENVKNASKKDKQSGDEKEGNKGSKNSRNDPENKENVSVEEEEEHTDNSKRQSNYSRREVYSTNNSIGFGSCDVQLSDDGKNVFLTSEILKEHDNSIDRNIIKEKYFQSQLIELERREMVSRSTSMEKKQERERNTQTGFSLKTGVSVSCQYSPSFLSKSDEVDYVEPETFSKTRENFSEERRPLQVEEQCDEGLNDKKVEKTISHKDSSSSSTPARTSNSLDKNSVIGRALSFEYLPGHLYESTAKEKSRIVNEKNLSLGDSLRSTEAQSTPQSKDQGKETDSAYTLVLEDTYRSLESEKMKTLHNNLTELEVVVSRLHEKEAIFQEITNSMFATVSRVDGSGDMPNHSGGSELNNNSLKTEEICCEVEISKDTDESKCSKPGEENTRIPNDISTACQTEDVEPDPCQFYEERKKVEERMSNEKQQQIKWIENEIKHLNMLRSLLEKQEDSKSQKKKRSHYLTESKNSISNSLKKDMLKDLIAEPTTKVSENDNAKEHSQATDCASQTVKELTEAPVAPTPCAQFGMAFSLRKGNNLQEVTMLPVGVQVTLKDRKNRSRPASSEQTITVMSDTSKNGSNRSRKPMSGSRQIDVGIQYPSVTDRYRQDSRTVITDESRSRCGCIKCNNIRCVCVNTTEETEKRKSPHTSSRQSEKYCEDSVIRCLSSTEEYPKAEDVKIPEIRNIGRAVSSSGTPSSCLVTRSRGSSKTDQSNILRFEGLLNPDKCFCVCHAEPLPRCDLCKLLNTCKKCYCYRRINSCICESPSVQKNGSYLYRSEPCQQCHNSRLQTKECSFNENTGKKCYQERSCQTDGDQCNFCSCINEQCKESDFKRDSKYLSDAVNETELKQPTKEMYPFEVKLPVENKNCTEMKNGAQLKNEVEIRCPWSTSNVKESISKAQCGCKNRKKQIVEEPRHYFLQLEETTEEESSDSGGSHNQLDVITIKVPIRKVCKANRNAESHQNSRNPPSNSNHSQKAKYFEQKIKEGGECHCCEDCKGIKKYEKADTADEESQVEGQYGQNNCYSCCPGHEILREEQENASGDEYESRKISKAGMKDDSMIGFNSQHQNKQNGEDNKCHCCGGPSGAIYQSQVYSSNNWECNGGGSQHPSENTELSSVPESDVGKPDAKHSPQLQKKNCRSIKPKLIKENMHSKTCSSHSKAKGATKEKCKPPDFYNFNKKEYLTKSELEREKKGKKQTRLTLQDCLSVKRPDLFTRAECRRKIITEKSRDRAERHTKKMECLTRLLPQCDIPANKDLRLFTSKEMRKQTRKFCKNLPEVVSKKEEEKKIMQFRTNKLLSEIFAKKLQLQTLKGRLNLSNSITVMSTM